MHSTKLPEGKFCEDCSRCEWCVRALGVDSGSPECIFYPIWFTTTGEKRKAVRKIRLYARTKEEKMKIAKAYIEGNPVYQVVELDILRRPNEVTIEDIMEGKGEFWVEEKLTAWQRALLPIVDAKFVMIDKYKTKVTKFNKKDRNKCIYAHGCGWYSYKEALEKIKPV